MKGVGWEEMRVEMGYLGHVEGFWRDELFLRLDLGDGDPSLKWIWRGQTYQSTEEEDRRRCDDRWEDRRAPEAGRGGCRWGCRG